MRFFKRKPKRIIKSIYFRWILSFTLMIIVAQLISFAVGISSTASDLIEQISVRIYNKAGALKEIYNSNHNLTDATLTLMSDTDISLNFIYEDDIDLGSHPYFSSITLDMIAKVKKGEIVIGYIQQKNNQGMPFGLLDLGDKLAILTPGFADSKGEYVFGAMRNAMVLSAVISSLLIVCNILLFLKPVKKVITATKEVAKGNFAIKIHHDSSDEIGELIENFNKMTSELSKVEYLRKDFVSNVSHEFKTPITSIEGFARLLQSHNLTPDQYEEYTEIIIKETQRLTNLSSNLLKISILDSSNFEPEKKIYSLDEQIRNTILLLEKQWTEKKLKLDIDLETMEINANEELLSQVWINLIQNAIKFSYHGTVMEIKLWQTDVSAIVSIKNQGKEIPDKDRERIFDRFYKADKSRSGEGNGLGLAIVKRIVDTLNGTVECESLNNMTIFTVKLPKQTNI